MTLSNFDGRSFEGSCTGDIEEKIDKNYVKGYLKDLSSVSVVPGLVTKKGRERLGSIYREDSKYYKDIRKSNKGKKDAIRSVKRDSSLSSSEKKNKIKKIKSTHKGNKAKALQTNRQAKVKRYAAGGVNELLNYSCTMNESIPSDNLLG